MTQRTKNKEDLDEVAKTGFRASAKWAECGGVLPRAGRTAPILASLTSSCRRHDVDPQLYFMQLLMNLPSWRASDLDAWLPDQWKLAQAARRAALGIPAPPTT